MFRHAVAIGLRFGFCDRREIGVDARGRIGHVLAEKLLSHKKSTCGRGRLFRLGRHGEKEAFAEEARASGIRREGHAVEIFGWRRYAVDARQFAVDMAVIRGEEWVMKSRLFQTRSETKVVASCVMELAVSRV